MKSLLVVLLLGVASMCEQPKLVFYTGQNIYSDIKVYVTPSPKDIGSTQYFGFNVKNSTTIHIYTFSGLIDSMRLNLKPTQLTNIYYVSQTIIDNSLHWEYIMQTQNSSTYLFSIYDLQGKTMVSDSGIASYGFDGKNTYIYSRHRNGLKSWKFRENIVP